jgi:hypothetical protein
MARSCTVCECPDVTEIDIALAARTPHAAVAEQYGLSPSAVFRHSKAHLVSNASRAVALREETQELLDLGLTKDEQVIHQLLAETVATAQKIMREAELADQPVTALRALKEVRDSLALIEKFTGKREIINTVNEELQSKFDALVIALRQVLPSQREAAREIVTALKMQNAWDLASVIERTLLLNGEVKR